MKNHKLYRLLVIRWAILAVVILLSMIPILAAFGGGSPKTITLGNSNILGVHLQDVTDGFEIVEVKANSPAQRAGLLAGDILVSIDYQREFTIEEVNEIRDKIRRGELEGATWLIKRGRNSITYRLVK